MRTPIKAELKEMLRRLKLPTFATQHAAQSALAASEGWSCDQYLLRLFETEINEQKTPKAGAAPASIEVATRGDAGKL